jgi:hypothetical protein
MNVRQPNQIERGNYQDANDSTKISTINRDREKQQTRANLMRNGNGGGCLHRSSRA